MNRVYPILFLIGALVLIFKYKLKESHKTRKHCLDCLELYCEHPCHVGTDCGCQREECKAEDQEANT